MCGRCHPCRRVTPAKVRGKMGIGDFCKPVEFHRRFSARDRLIRMPRPAAQAGTATLLARGNRSEYTSKSLGTVNAVCCRRVACEIGGSILLNVEVARARHARYRASTMGRQIMIEAAINGNAMRESN